ncbi:MAG TPA: metallopeptidase TldD-related protein, partial [Terriglobales bacterium]|nr:metallopeptidase TldD-related protein [Terriglobales bacterium]
MKRKLLPVLLLLTATLAYAQNDVVMRAMRDELKRTLTSLQMKGMDKPYFVSYRVDDVRTLAVSATLGSLTATGPTRRRVLAVEVRVGDYKLDNTNFLSMRGFGGRMFSGYGEAPIDDNYLEIRRSLWLATDRQYKRALEDLTAKRAALETHRRAEDVPDFSPQQPQKYFEPARPMPFDSVHVEQLGREVSAIFRQSPQVMTSSVSLAVMDEYSRYINSDGTEYERAKPFITVQVKGETQANDGLPISDSFVLYAKSLDQVTDKQLLDGTRDLAARLVKLQSAPLMDRYTGPVLFENDAAAEIFADVFVPGLVAARAPITDEPQAEAAFTQITARMGGASFAEKIGGRVLPDFVDVTDEPGMEKFGDTPLCGTYKIDDEGVPSRETKLVEGGIVKAVLASRIPAGTIRQSTGSRRGMGASPSNLIFTAHKTASTTDLRAELLNKAKARGLDYGIIVRHAGGGGLDSMRSFFLRMQAGGDAGTSLLEVYKYFADGHEQLVRGAELTEMNVSSFKDIVAAGDKPIVYNDIFVPKLNSIFAVMSGGGSDWAGMPIVSYVVPSLLFDEM